LNRQYTTIAMVGAVLFFVLGFALTWYSAIGFLIGAVLSGLTGFIGMNISVRANVRTAQAAHNGMNAALAVAFRGGAITGMLVVGLGLLGVAGYYVCRWSANAALHAFPDLAFGGSRFRSYLLGAAASSRRAGAAPTPAVGRVEAGIPETIRAIRGHRRNVGDSVGDCAGMAAEGCSDLRGNVVATMLLLPAS
jgi:K(+)-stimulated pyrophosphate-energized sodium pump